MHRLAVRITDYLIARGVSKSSERDYYIYGCEMLLLKLVNMGTLLCIAVAMDNPVEGIALLLTFMTLRKYTGGFHLGSALSCYVFTALVYGISLYVCTEYRFCKGMCLIIALISYVVIASYAPIDNPNLNLTAGEIKAMKKQLRKILLILLVVIVVLKSCGEGIRYIAPIVMGIGLDALFMVVANILRKRGDKDAEGKKKRFGIG